MTLIVSFRAEFSVWPCDFIFVFVFCYCYIKIYSVMAYSMEFSFIFCTNNKPLVKIVFVSHHINIDIFKLKIICLVQYVCNKEIVEGLKEMENKKKKKKCANLRWKDVKRNDFIELTFWFEWKHTQSVSRQVFYCGFAKIWHFSCISYIFFFSRYRYTESEIN